MQSINLIINRRSFALTWGIFLSVKLAGTKTASGLTGAGRFIGRGETAARTESLDIPCTLGTRG